MHTLTEETYVNADSTKVAKKGSVESAYLLGLKGDEISNETAKRLGLISDEEATAETPKTKADLMADLDAAGVEYPSKATKKELEDLVEANVGESASGTSDQGEAEATDGTKQAESTAEA